MTGTPKFKLKKKKNNGFPIADLFLFSFFITNDERHTPHAAQPVAGGLEIQ
ncbi:hypothetical protein SLEP1_g30720 [Rubroshorea leprosula]|uniref:Uncharacterized protein n=1 Tax=Rubroshorea leprosula TaxID=152421 RepID=A0AAV5KAQ0_9ROSI|nr:hypothetical protein SLEP1_g30720 [Rubroshorea leprosula]